MSFTDAMRSFWSGAPTASDQYELAGVEWPATVTIGDVTFDLETLANVYVRKIPALMRGRQLIADTISMLPVEAMRSGMPVPTEPAIVRRPDPDLSRQEFIQETVLEMMEGNAYWLVDRLDGLPISVKVAQADDVTVSWNASRTRRVYTYRDRTMSTGYDLIPIPLQRRASDLEGVGPMQSSALAEIVAVRDFVDAYFTEAANPSGLITSEYEYDDGDAADVLAGWNASTAKRGPRFLSGGMKWQSEMMFPEGDGVSNAHHGGIVDIANILGIPPPLLSAAIIGGNSSIVYANQSALMESWTRTTLQPTYMTRIEGAWSTLLPRGQNVQMNTNVLIRGSIKERMEVHNLAIPLGIETVDEARHAEGLPPTDQTASEPAVSTGPRVPSPEA